MNKNETKEKIPLIRLIYEEISFVFYESKISIKKYSESKQ